MSKSASSIDARITGQALKLRDHVLLEGAMATGALVALADQRLTIEETVAVGAVLENTKTLQLHDPNYALSLYTRHLDAIRSDYAAGREAALKAVALCADDMEAAELIVRIGIAVAKADSEFSPPELEVIEDICTSLAITGLDPLALAGSSRTLAH